MTIEYMFTHSIYIYIITLRVQSSAYRRVWGENTYMEKQGLKTHKWRNRVFVKLAVPTPSIARPPFEQRFGVILGPVANGCAISAGWQVQFLIC